MGIVPPFCVLVHTKQQNCETKLVECNIMYVSVHVDVLYVQ